MTVNAADQESSQLEDSPTIPHDVSSAASSSSDLVPTVLDSLSVQPETQLTECAESLSPSTIEQGVQMEREADLEDHIESEAKQSTAEATHGPITASPSSEAESGRTESGDDDGDASSSGDSDEDDEDEEPTLKYSRMEGGVNEILEKDSTSSLAVSTKFIVLGTHNGAIFVLDLQGIIYSRFQPHAAMINDLSIDLASEFIASASMDGKVAIQSLTTPESYIFDLRRPMRCVSLEPTFGKRSTRQFVSGGMAGNLVLHEKGWLGYKEVILHSGEGPIWTVEWRGNLIAWANDAGIRIYDTSSNQRITYISRADDSPRADLFKCSLYWQSDTTLLIAWADYIKVAEVKSREPKRNALAVGITSTVELYVEVTRIFQVDCMISGIAPYGNEYLILAYIVEEDETDETNDQRRKEGSRPELRIISQEGEELSSDALSLRSFARFQCQDYSLRPAPGVGSGFYVISPKDIVVAKSRDEGDHIGWLIEQGRYEKALESLEKAGARGTEFGYDVKEVGKKYLDFLISEGQFERAAAMCPKILGINAKSWEDWIFLFADKGEIKTIIPYVPTHDPQLSRLVYEMILAHFLRHDLDALLRTIKSWPNEIYDVASVLVAIQDQLERKPGSKILMESLAELFILNRQPGKALPYYLKLRRPGVFDLIRDNNLFTDVQDQALLLIEFDQDMQANEKHSKEGTETGRVDLKKGDDADVARADEHAADGSRHGTAVALLIDHTHSIPIARVVQQLSARRQFLFMYLDALFDKDPHLAFDYSDLQVTLYAEFDANKLMDFLRASNYYSLEEAYKICDAKDLVPEMVFLLGRMGDNKRALNLIIERLGDVQRAIQFAKEQDDHDLWEDLLKYSETKPIFIRALLENVGAEIDPIRLIRRIKNGLEIPGLKVALIKILQDFNLQISLMEGCQNILYSDCRQLALQLNAAQASGFLWTADTACRISNLPIFPQLDGVTLIDEVPLGVHYLCGDTFDASHAFPASVSSTSPLKLPSTSRDLLAASLLEQPNRGGGHAAAKAMATKLRLAAELLNGQSGQRSGTGCSVCLKTVTLK